MATEPKLSIVPKSAYFDIKVAGGDDLGRVTFNLFANAPRSARNFGLLCESSYANTFFHRVIPGFMCQFGDVTEAKVNAEGKPIPGPNRRPGTGGASALGTNKFNDDLFINKHKLGSLSMANAGVNTNGSQIFICTAVTSHLDGKHVVFGEIASGMDTIKKVEALGSDSGDVRGTVYVSAAGVTEYYTQDEVKQYLVPKKAFFEITVNNEPLGTVNFTLFNNTPWTSLNFGLLCKGFTAGGKQYTYANTFFHRVIPNFMCQFGDITEAKVGAPGPNRRPGTGGVPGVAAFTGKLKFQDENFINKHRVGALSMANSGAGTNGSQIFICTAACNHLNGKHVVFGTVASNEDLEVIKKVESYGSAGGETRAQVVVSKSGVSEYYTEEESFGSINTPM